MYIPQKFALSDEETEAALADAGFAQLVTHDSSGFLITPLPLIFDGHSLVGHVSRANPHWHADGRESVAIFSGPQAYISPSFYAMKAETARWCRPGTTTCSMSTASSSLTTMRIGCSTSSRC